MTPKVSGAAFPIIQVSPDRMQTVASEEGQSCPSTAPIKEGMHSGSTTRPLLPPHHSLLPDPILVWNLLSACFQPSPPPAAPSFPPGCCFRLVLPPDQRNRERLSSKCRKWYSRDCAGANWAAPQSLPSRGQRPQADQLPQLFGRTGSCQPSSAPSLLPDGEGRMLRTPGDWMVSYAASTPSRPEPVGREGAPPFSGPGHFPGLGLWKSTPNYWVKV